VSGKQESLRSSQAPSQISGLAISGAVGALARATETAGFLARSRRALTAEEQLAFWHALNESPKRRLGAVMRGK
jgi:hypothetical protein